MPHESDKTELVSQITDIEIVAIGSNIREIERLRNAYGGSRWRKLKGVAYVREEDETVILAEVHWYECHGIGRREVKVKRYLEE